ncbi:MAG: AmmeMemoRadiSam system protein B [bacterium]
MKIRKPYVAGQFYSDEPGELAAQVNMFIEQAAIPEIKGKPSAIISPHAGYVYSGAVAGHAFKAVKGLNYESVIVISPSHMERFEFVSIYSGDFYQTPMGNIPVSSRLREELAQKSGNINPSRQGHEGMAVMGRGEHALEVELPFIQGAIGSFELVPLVMGSQDFDLCEELGQAMADVFRDKNALIVASTDLSHFHDYKSAVDMDGALLNYLEKFDIKGLYRSVQKGETEACGSGPIISAMIACREMGAKNCMVLKYANSGDISFGDKSSVVGYAAAVIV